MHLQIAQEVGQQKHMSKEWGFGEGRKTGMLCPGQAEMDSRWAKKYLHLTVGEGQLC